MMTDHLAQLALSKLHEDSEGFGWKLQEILYELKQLSLNTTPVDDPVYNNARTATATGLSSSLFVASGPCRLYGFSGVNTNAAAQFIQGFNLERATVPSNGTVPDFVTKAPASDNFWMSWAPAWRNMTQGLILCNSSTAGTLTIGAADCFFDAQWDAAS